ncbi:MAG: tRNA (adenosine(37)-N6)-threonylcarbamoyltransferase complex dimerization subunit type 1 TsaB [Saprospiraceae bacterium]
MADLLLLLETSGEQCSVAIAQLEGTTQKVLAEAEHTVPMKHTAMLLPLIKEAFAKTPYTLQETSAVAVSTGPGSYTALRAGYSSAKGLCLALDIPMITVSTLKAATSSALAIKTDWSGEIIAILPARRKDVYFARFNQQLDTLIAPVCVEANEEWWEEQLKDSSTMLVGPTVEQLTEDHDLRVTHLTVSLKASNLLAVAAMKYRAKDFADTSSVEPNYVKPPFITQAKPRFGS